MDQNRPETNSQQQNVHLHMHQVVCGCHGNLYPTPATAYYQPVSYRTPPPPMMTFNPQQLARPYLQHYQYTQFNQFSLPVPQVAAGGATAATSTTAAAVYSSNNQTEILFGARDRRERLESVQDEMLETEKPNETGYDYGHVSPPPTKDILATANSEENISENFVKFLERSCITAEQIAHRNRNRPCFRNIQNLCVRTRSEILKPCTTVSNIHSQGIPWATKDFIYAFVRLTNCWHILRGYWDNRDGPAIGKITKELTPEFRECYVRWEKETVELAAQLTKVFYNLDTNINSSMHSTASLHAANNLIPPQVNLIKNPEFPKSSVETLTTTNTPIQPPSKNGNRSVLHLSSPAETSDQANQTCSVDFYGKSPTDTMNDCIMLMDNNEDEEVNTKIYMKPGSYNVPKRTVANNTETSFLNGSPRTIEFLETAQNVEKVMEAAGADRYWTKNKIIAKPIKEDIEVGAPQFNVQKWLISSRFSDYDNGSTGSSSPPNIGGTAYYIDTPTPISFEIGGCLTQEHENMSHQKNNGNGNATFTLLQRDKTASMLMSTPKNCLNNGNRTEIGYCGVKGNENLKNKSNNKATYENKMGGLTDLAVDILESIIGELKATEFAEYISRVKPEDHLPISNLDWILNKLKTKQYKYVNEVVRDLYYVVNLTQIYYGNFLDLDSKIDVFVQRIQTMLDARFNHFDFSTINGLKDELVGPLKLKVTKLDGDGDHLN